MSFDMSFVLNSLFLGVGLAMDAFSVSLANGLQEPNMRKRKIGGVAGVFAGFQFVMPMLGYICVSTAVRCFCAFEPFIPWIALLLLGFIGGKMIVDGVKGTEEADLPAVGFVALMVQGVATSIDALSVGFTVAEYSWAQALVACLIIGAVTFVICAVGLVIGKTVGTALAGKAGIFGGIILIVIGLEIFITSRF